MRVCQKNILVVNRRTGHYYLLADRGFLGREHHRPLTGIFYECTSLLGDETVSMKTACKESLYMCGIS